MNHYGLGKILAIFWRFKLLEFSNWWFRNVPSTCALSRSLFGYNFSIDVSRSVTHRLLYLEGERQIGESRLLRSLLRPGMRVIDVGANIGYYLLLFERTIKEQGEIICFEPGPENLFELKRNIALNNFKNVVLHESAAGSSAGVTGLMSGTNGRIAEQGGSINIPVVTLDSMLQTRVDMVKIDVEGYEMHVLLGARKIIETHKPRIFLEFHPGQVKRYGNSFQDVRDFLLRYYSRLRYFEIPVGASVLRKISVRYLAYDPVRELSSEEVECHLNSGRRETFWIICQH